MSFETLSTEPLRNVSKARRMGIASLNPSYAIAIVRESHPTRDEERQIASTE